MFTLKGLSMSEYKTGQVGMFASLASCHAILSSILLSPRTRVVVAPQILWRSVLHNERGELVQAQGYAVVQGVVHKIVGSDEQDRRQSGEEVAYPAGTASKRAALGADVCATIAGCASDAR